MTGAGKYLVAALLIAVATHLAIVFAMPNALMGVAMEKLSDHGRHYNSWRRAARVTEDSREIVRPSPDLHYSACPYDLSRGPVTIRVAPSAQQWSLSLFADNSDNFYVTDDREAHDGAAITLVRAGHSAPANAQNVIQSPSDKGVALVRRLAPTQTEFEAAEQVAQRDVCARLHS